MKKTIAVIYGGQNSEHSVSCVSAGNVVANLDRTKYTVIPIGITEQGRWVQSDPNQLPVNFQLGLSQVADIGPTVRIVSRSQAHLYADDTVIPVDVVIPMLHGKFGEDGTIQGYLEILGIPYVGCKVLSSALCMDKGFTKRVLSAAGLPVCPYEYRDYAIETYEEVNPSGDSLHEDFRASFSDAQFSPENPQSALYVKPARAGSSVGVNRVVDQQELILAIKHALEIDSKIIIEPEIIGQEIEVAVLEQPDGTLTASTPCEIQKPAEHQIYDFSAKYEQDTVIVAVPAPISQRDITQIQTLAMQAFRALDCRGLARVDFFLTDSGPLINEINTMPGFTPISAYPKMMAYDGISYAQLLDLLVEGALSSSPKVRLPL